jgi:hypothetical protein
MSVQTLPQPNLTQRLKLDACAAHESALGMQLISHSVDYQKYVTRNTWFKLTVHTTEFGSVVFCARDRRTHDITQVFLDAESVIRFAASENEAAQWNCD